ncbi:protein phosphatase 2C family protein [Artemisia annua]|uniref:Protein phosphatase 2C family protein n=1 Tax=Artemisia annua TaxID=35608 RepID=A0A2U1KIY3_ARTAN|nr:protein phosphatase 2C family protein [Artemisia annua]
MMTLNLNHLDPSGSRWVYMSYLLYPTSEKKEPVSTKPSDGHPGDITDADDDLPDDELAEDPSTNPEDNIDWSALEGVSRVNTLLTLPRFVPEEIRKNYLKKKAKKLKKEQGPDYIRVLGQKWLYSGGSGVFVKYCEGPTDGVLLIGRKQESPSEIPNNTYFREDHLHRVPGRLFLNGKKGTNQDAMIVWEYLDSCLKGSSTCFETWLDGSTCLLDITVLLYGEIIVDSLCSKVCALFRGDECVCYALLQWLAFKGVFTNGLYFSRKTLITDNDDDFVTDPLTSNSNSISNHSTSGVGCTAAALECLLSIVRALRMGSCLSGESRSPHPRSPTTPTSCGGRKRKISKKRTSRNSSFNLHREDHLHRVPGRLFLNGSSEVASLFTQQGKKGTNQDAMIVWETNGLYFSRKTLITDNADGCTTAALECLLSIVRALRMGSCLSGESRSPHPRSPTTPTSGGGRKRKSSKKRTSRNSSFNLHREDHLHRVPGRLFLNGSSEVASLFTQQGKKGTNQDAMIVWEKYTLGSTCFETWLDGSTCLLDITVLLYGEIIVDSLCSKVCALFRGDECVCYALLQWLAFKGVFNFGSRTDTVFCGVFDGHGPFGHMVAKRVRDSLPLKLSANCDVNIKGSSDVLREIILNEEATFTSEDSRAFSDLEINKNPEKLQALKDLFLKAFKVMDRELRLIFILGNTWRLKSILGNEMSELSISCLAASVTIDQENPNLPAEAERIRKCKGRVFALQDEPDVSRVWLPDNDSPGLAMARAFGDFCLKDFGLISVPDIFYRRLTENDQFVVLATDGYFCPPTDPFDQYSNGLLSNPLVFSYPKFHIFWCIYFFELRIWDVLTNKEVVDIVSSAETRSCAARSVVESAVRSWNIRYPTSKVDDCTVVCLFLTPHPNNISTASATEFDTSSEKKEPVSTKPSDGYPGDITDADDDLPNDELAEDPSTNPEDKMDWSALEGVSCVNTLLTLPRFVPEEVEKQTPGQKKTN